MNQNILDVINSLGETNKLYFVGEVDLSEIAQAAETLNVEFAKDFVEYVQRFGSISVGSIELCGIDEDPDCSTVDRTLEMRDLFSDFPMDCYVIESVGIDNAVMVQKSDGKISYDEKADNISAHIFINCEPDYFADHSIEVYMDSKGNIDVIGLAG